MTCMKKILASLLLFTVCSFAIDIMATTPNGSKVILHDNGRWEYVKNNSQAKDIRPNANKAAEQPDEEIEFEINVEYEPVERIKKNVRLAMEAEFATEEEIKDSLRSVPKGGVVYFQIPTKQIKKGEPREFKYVIYDGGKNPVFSKTGRDTDAVASEIHGMSNLIVVPLFSRPKSKVLKASVIYFDQSIDFEIAVQ